MLILLLCIFCPQRIHGTWQYMGAIGSAGSADKEFNSPTGIVIDAGTLYIADTANNRIQVTNGEEWAIIGGSGDSDGQLNAPNGLFLDPQKRLYVADGGNNRIQVFAGADYQFLEKFGSANPTEGGLRMPTAVTVYEDNAYVVDSGNNCIKVFHKEGNAPYVFTNSFGRNGELLGPTDIAFSSGLLYVVDSENHRIQVFSPDGTFVKTIGRHGTGNDEFRNPTGLGVSETNVLYVVDSGNWRVHPEYGSEIKFGMRGINSDTFQFPYKLATDGGMFFITDMGNHRILVFADVLSSDARFPEPGIFQAPVPLAPKQNFIKLGLTPAPVPFVNPLHPMYSSLGITPMPQKILLSGTSFELGITPMPHFWLQLYPVGITFMPSFAPTATIKPRNTINAIMPVPPNFIRSEISMGLGSTPMPSFTPTPTIKPRNTINAIMPVQPSFIRSEISMGLSSTPMPSFTPTATIKPRNTINALMPVQPSFIRSEISMGLGSTPMPSFTPTPTIKPRNTINALMPVQPSFIRSEISMGLGSTPMPSFTPTPTIKPRNTINALMPVQPSFVTTQIPIGLGLTPIPSSVPMNPKKTVANIGIFASPQPIAIASATALPTNFSIAPNPTIVSLESPTLGLFPMPKEVIMRNSQIIATMGVAMSPVYEPYLVKRIDTEISITPGPSYYPIIDAQIEYPWSFTPNPTPITSKIPLLGVTPIVSDIPTVVTTMPNIVGLTPMPATLPEILPVVGINIGLTPMVEPLKNLAPQEFIVSQSVSPAPIKIMQKTPEIGITPTANNLVTTAAPILPEIGALMPVLPEAAVTKVQIEMSAVPAPVSIATRSYDLRLTPAPKEPTSNNKLKMPLGITPAPAIVQPIPTLGLTPAPVAPPRGAQPLLGGVLLGPTAAPIALNYKEPPQPTPTPPAPPELALPSDRCNACATAAAMTLNLLARNYHPQTHQLKSDHNFTIPQALPDNFMQFQRMLEENPERFRKLMLQVSPESYFALDVAGLLHLQSFHKTVFESLLGRSDVDKTVTSGDYRNFWISVYNSQFKAPQNLDDLRAEKCFSGYSITGKAVALGLDKQANKQVLWGLAMSHGMSTANDIVDSKARITQYQLGTYLRFTPTRNNAYNRFFADLLFSFGYEDSKMKRIIAIDNLQLVASASNKLSHSGKVELGYDFGSPHLNLKPIVGLEFTRKTAQRFMESGTDPMLLWSFPNRTNNHFMGTVGLRISGLSYASIKSLKSTGVFLQAGWNSQFLSDDMYYYKIKSVLLSSPDISILATGNMPSKQNFKLDMGIIMKFSDFHTLSLTGGFTSNKQLYSNIMYSTRF